MIFWLNHFHSIIFCLFSIRPFGLLVFCTMIIDWWIRRQFQVASNHHARYFAFFLIRGSACLPMTSQRSISIFKTKGDSIKRSFMLFKIYSKNYIKFIHFNLCTLNANTDFVFLFIHLAPIWFRFHFQLNFISISSTFQRSTWFNNRNSTILICLWALFIFHYSLCFYFPNNWFWSNVRFIIIIINFV